MALGGPMLRITFSPSYQNTTAAHEEKSTVHFPIQIKCGVQVNRFYSMWMVSSNFDRTTRVEDLEKP